MESAARDAGPPSATTWGRDFAADLLQVQQRATADASFDCSRRNRGEPPPSGYGSSLREAFGMRRRVPSGDAAEDGAGHQARAAGVVVEEEAAGDLAGGVEAGDRVARGVLDLGVAGDLEAAEGEGDARCHGIGLVGRLVEGLGPVGLVDCEA